MCRVAAPPCLWIWTWRSCQRNQSPPQRIQIISNDNHTQKEKAPPPAGTHNIKRTIETATLEHSIFSSITQSFFDQGTKFQKLTPEAKAQPQSAEEERLEDQGIKILVSPHIPMGILISQKINIFLIFSSPPTSESLKIWRTRFTPTISKIRDPSSMWNPIFFLRKCKPLSSQKILHTKVKSTIYLLQQFFFPFRTNVFFPNFFLLFKKWPKI